MKDFCSDHFACTSECYTEVIIPTNYIFISGFLWILGKIPHCNLPSLFSSLTMPVPIPITVYTIMLHNLTLPFNINSSITVTEKPYQLKPHRLCLINLFIYLGFYITFNTVQVISRWIVGRAEETSKYSWSRFCIVNCWPTTSNYQLSHSR